MMDKLSEDYHFADELVMSENPKSKQDVNEQETTQVDEAASETLVAQEEPQPAREEQLKNELAENKERMLRIAADFENFKKISQREQQNSVKFANESLIVSMLPIIDGLDQAVFACKKSMDANKDVLVGVEMVQKQLIDTLKKWGVEVFSAEGQPFDPSKHEAMGEKEDDSVKENTVVTEYQKGYLLNGRLLRPARVIVSKKSGA
jgi:molecular chaperone GrpE